jgi:hypothetical protein
MGAELDSLRRDVAEKALPAVAPDTGKSATAAPKPILGELLSDREKILAQANAASYRRMAAGYVFILDQEFPLGMDVTDWFGDWGAKLEATAWLGENDRLAAGNASLLRSLHRFAPFAGIQTHLYAFAGAGYSWRREQIDRFLSPLPASSRRWYEEPDRVGRIKLGAGSEIGLLALGGLQGTPEIGLQATRFFGRFQDSPSWPAFNPSGSRPKSDFALTGYLAFHLSFYFR